MSALNQSPLMTRSSFKDVELSTLRTARGNDMMRIIIFLKPDPSVLCVTVCSEIIYS